MNYSKDAEIAMLAEFLRGFAAASKGDGCQKLDKAADWLEKLSRYICGQGYIGCHGGTNCSSDHK